MKELAVKNYKTAEGQKISEGGTGIVRTANGDVRVKAGDAITFPTGPEGAHVIRNGSDTEKLVYIDFDTNNLPEIVHLPDTNQVMAYGKFSNGVYDKK